jgi:hypothetical protein
MSGAIALSKRGVILAEHGLCDFHPSDRRAAHWTLL